MLPEKVLEELTRRTPFTREIVATAWPSLSTESRLQIVQVLQGDGFTASTPQWLAELALDDPAPIVRYWAAKRTYFKRGDAPEYAKGFEFMAATEEDKALVARAESDACDLVRLCVEQGEKVNFKKLHEVPQRMRLAFLRHLTGPHFETFMDWLSDSVDAGLPDTDLRDCAEEYFGLPEVQRELRQKSHEIVDGYDAYLRGKGMEKGWDVVAKCGPALRTLLSYSLPTKYGLGTMAVTQLSTLPDQALEALIYRAEESEEAAGLVTMMRSSPEKFSERVLKSLATYDEYAHEMPSYRERENERQRQAVERQQAMLDAVLELKRDLDVLRGEMREYASRKRGLFG